MDALLDAMKQLLEVGVDAAVILDEERRILYYNRAYEATAPMRGRALKQAVDAGARCYDVMRLEICQTACAACKARELGKPVRVDEVRSTRADGEDATLIVGATPIGPYVIETYRDVTAEVRIQRRLKDLLDAERKQKDELEAIIARRTRELEAMHAQLVLKEKMSSLGRLVAGVAHELNNPINFVYGNVDFVGQYMDDLVSVIRAIDPDELSPEGRARFEAIRQKIDLDYLIADSRKLINSIRSGAERTATIVRDLRGFSRTTGGEMQETDVVAGIETTLNLISPLHRGRITIERDFQPELPRLVCNAGHVNQVFMNLLTNAAQAIKGPGTIRITVRTADADGRPAIVVSVRDTGPGIPPELIQKIRDPFFTTKPVGEGTGLGLWICENIVRSHGGTLSCESEVGAGSTFTVTLPLRPDAGLRPPAAHDA